MCIRGSRFSFYGLRHQPIFVLKYAVVINIQFDTSIIGVQHVRMQGSNSHSL